MTRKVDRAGNVSFAGTSYRVGNAFKRRQAQVAVVGDTVARRFRHSLPVGSVTNYRRQINAPPPDTVTVAVDR